MQLCCVRRAAAHLRLAALWALMGTSLASSACALPAHIDDGLFAHLSSDRKLLLFDAENDVRTAEDAQAQMQERLVELRGQSRMAVDEARWAETESQQVDIADGRAGPVQALETWRQRQAYLQEASGYLRQRIRVQRHVINAALARFELVKAQEAQKEKLLSRDKVNLPKFVAQVVAYADTRNKALARLAPRQARCERARQAWLVKRDDLAARNMQKMGMVGADEVPVWELW